MFSFFSKRIHESFVLSGYLSAALALHVAWMANWLVFRSDDVRERLTLVDAIGPLSGLYLKTFGVFVFFFGLLTLLFRKRDLSLLRERIIWFFVISVVLFVFMTFPFVFELMVTPSTI